MYKSKLIPIALVLVILSSLALWVNTSEATPGSGVTAQPIASGKLGDAVRAKFKPETGVVRADVSNVTLVKYTVAPGGVFGWHQHGGPLWAVVAAGTLTFYDTTCTGVAYSQGSTFMDPGNHTHNARNESTTEEVVVYVTFMLPKDGVTRIDVNPAPCNLP